MLNQPLQDLTFKGVEVYWGSAEQRAVLFGSDCHGIQSHIGQPRFLDLAVTIL